eukprot:jgi/Bigna1/80020/fgenesh1_pg.67_\
MASARQRCRGLLLALLTAALPRTLGWADWLPESQPFPHYFADDLNDRNFVNEMRRNPDEILLVEFYADWCPHCQQFAPDYERIAEAYKHTGQIRACKIDCASNGQRMCDQFSVKFFPTLLFGYADDFAARAKFKNATRPLEIPSQDIGQTAENITSWLNHQIGGIAELLPLRQFQQTMKMKLETEAARYVHHRRVLENHVNMWDVKLATAMSLYNMITLLHYDPAGQEVEDGAESGTGGPGPGESRQADLDAALGFLDALCTSYPDYSARATFCSMGTFVETQNTVAVGDRVVIMGMTKARALNGHKGWVKAYNHTTDRYTRNLSSSNNPPLQNKVAQLDGSVNDFFSSSEEAWAAIESRYTIANTRWMDFKKGWKSCKGSWGHTRGYTCGLWTLFHTLLANAPDDYAPNVLLAIEGFVARFFGCDSCRRHFLAMSEDIILLSTKEEAVMWLWEAHNKVNKRVGAQEQEYGGDPSFPKAQWPTKQLCPGCYKEGWISGEAHGKTETFQFLLRFYAPRFQMSRGDSSHLLGVSSISGSSSSSSHGGGLSVAHAANNERREEILRRKEALEEERAYYRGFLGTGTICFFDLQYWERYSWQFLVECVLIAYLAYTYGYEAYEWIREKYKVWARRRKKAKHYL